MAELIDGKAVAEEVVGKVKQRTAELVEAGHRPPGLAVVIVGEDPASQVYVAAKGKKAKECGFLSVEHKLPRETTEADLLALIEELNADPKIDGILVQLPLPEHIGSRPGDPGDRAGEGRRRLPLRQCRQDRHRRAGTRLRALHAGRLDAADRAGARQGPVRARCGGVGPLQHRRQADGAICCWPPMRPSPSLTAARATCRRRAPGRHRGRRGRPAADGQGRLDQARRDGDRCRHQPHRHTDKGEGKTRLVGDVDFDAAAKVAGAITPVPGGVGPMTIAMLMANTLTSAYLAAGRDRPTF